MNKENQRYRVNDWTCKIVACTTGIAFATKKEALADYKMHKVNADKRFEKITYELNKVIYENNLSIMDDTWSEGKYPNLKIQEGNYDFGTNFNPYTYDWEIG